MAHTARFAANSPGSNTSRESLNVLLRKKKKKKNSWELFRSCSESLLSKSTIFLTRQSLDVIRSSGLLRGAVGALTAGTDDAFRFGGGTSSKRLNDLDGSFLTIS